MTRLVSDATALRSRRQSFGRGSRRVSDSAHRDGPGLAPAAARKAPCPRHALGAPTPIGGPPDILISDVVARFPLDWLVEPASEPRRPPGGESGELAAPSPSSLTKLECPDL